MFRRVTAVSVNTFREAVRDRVLLGMVGAALATLIFTLAMAELSLNEQRRVVFDLGVGAISLYSVVVAVFLGSALLYKEIERKTLYVVLPKPLHRHEFLLGKYFGIVLTGLVFIAITGAVQVWVTLAQQSAPPWMLWSLLLAPPAVLSGLLWWTKDGTRVLIPWSLLTLLAVSSAGWSRNIELWPLIASLTLTLCELCVLAAVAMVFSSFSTPFLTGVFTTGVWLLGRSADSMASMSPKALPAPLPDMLHALAKVVPNFHLFVPGRHALVTLTDAGGPGSYVATTAAYAVTYSIVLLAVAAWAFRRRDFL